MCIWKPEGLSYLAHAAQWLHCFFELFFLLSNDLAELFYFLLFVWPIGVASGAVRWRGLFANGPRADRCGVSLVRKNLNQGRGLEAGGPKRALVHHPRPVL